MLDLIQERFKLRLERLIVETPPRVELGDLAFPFPFELAKVLKKAPRQIAQEVVAGIQDSSPEGLPEVERFEAAGAGYVNLFFKRTRFASELWEWLRGSWPEPSGAKIIVEHTNINPNKAAHIGHLRNAVLGDTLVRLARARGRRVEVQNYIDNTGVQVADVVVGFRQLRRLSPAEVRSIEDPFDYYCWDLYAEVSEWYAQDPARLRFRDQVLREIEEGKGETAELAEYLSTRIVRAHLDTMARIGVRYDVLPRESEILHLKFWEEAFEQFKERQAITYVEEGPNRGCWVMRLPSEGGKEQEWEEKIIVRSNGTVTYVGKDMAYQLWKFGLLNKDFHYRPFFTYPDGRVVWATTADASLEESRPQQERPQFGRGEAVYNVIDVRQSYLQRVVVQGLKSLGYRREAEKSVHFSYEMVALSPACCRELGIELSEEDGKKPYVEVSGRKGLGVKADDLIDKLLEKSLQEVNQRQQELSEERRACMARQIAVAALRYFLLRYSRNSVIAFDFNEALSFEGETGPYLQYCVVRANNIFRKLEEEGEAAQPGEEAFWSQEEVLKDLLQDDEIWGLLAHTGRLEDAIEQSLQTLELSHLAKHAFTLAQLFNIFYHKYHILSEGDSYKKRFYLTVADAARQGLLKAIDLLGIEVPERM